MKTIVLTGGGTAGHVLPHLAILPYLRESFDNIYYIGGTNETEERIVTSAGVEFYKIRCTKLRRGMNIKNIISNLAIPVGYFKSVAEARAILKKLKPDVVFSKGGFVALPVVRAAKSLKIRVVAHESDMTVGLANKLSAGASTKICTTFKTTAERQKSDKFVYTGSPIREKIYKGERNIVNARHNLTSGFGGMVEVNLAAGKPMRNLLVVGGSSGAKAINDVVIAARDRLREYNIIHICGTGKGAGVVNTAYYTKVEYVDDIENYFAWADIVVSRAGSGAMCELMVLKKPTLFIPYASGRGDQVENVREMLKENAYGVLYEKDLTVDGFVDAVNDVWRNRDKYIKNAGNVVKDGTRNIYDTIYGVVCDVDYTNAAHSSRG
jgi:UDP-N-acetylglucosamine--N-acetylmuramyl-(pentapeptide) pyrophosphoryl-undecaprenol N-acetylglucosamine transferase